MALTHWTVPGGRGSVSLVLAGRSGTRAAMPASVARALVEERGSDALVAELGHALGGSLSEDLGALRQRVLRALDDGRLLVVHEGRGERRGGHAAEAPRDAPAPAPIATPTAKTWITIVLLDEAVPPRPVANARYRLRLPDRSVREGRLDATGKAHLEQLDAGMCEVSFPDYDRDVRGGDG